jgi:hypothetical protein
MNFESASLSSRYPWCGLVNDDSLEQGDFLFSCPVLEPTTSVSPEVGEESDLQVAVREYDVLILSQSCDLVQGKLETVLVCPHWPLSVLEQRESYFRSSRGKEDIRRGNSPGFHMLAACELAGFVSPVRVASFRQVFGLPLTYIQQQVSRQRPRLRLLPPYREHLAQAFARFIMRVGLPVDIPPFK